MSIECSKIKSMREKKGLCQGELAAQTYTTQTMISYVESGKRLPSLTLAYLIARALGCTIDDLIVDDDIKKSVPAVTGNGQRDVKNKTCL